MVTAVGAAAAAALIVSCGPVSSPSAVDLVAATSVAATAEAPPPTPTPTPSPTPVPPDPNAPTVLRLTYGDAPAQHGWLTLPARTVGDPTARHPIVVLVHGGFWRRHLDASQMFDLAAALAEEGVATWNVEVALVGNPDGGWPGSLVDMATAIDHLASMADEHRLAIDDVRLLGHSSGGHLAAWAAGRDQLPAGSPGAEPIVMPTHTVLLAPITDLIFSAANGDAAKHFIGGPPEEFPERYEHATPLFVPASTHVFLAELDRRVSPEHSANAAEAGVPVTIIPGVHHLALIDPTSPAWPPVREALLAP